MAVWPHTLYSFRGHFGPDVATHLETWSFNLRTGAEDNQSGGAATNTQAMADAASLACATFIDNTDSRFSTAVWYDELRLYNIGANGKMTAEPTISSPAAPVNGSVSGPHLPFQCSLVVSLTANGIGKGKRGRFYLPMQCLNVQTNGTVEPAQMATVVPQVVTFLNALNDSASSSPTHALGISGSTGAQGTFRTVRHISVGNVIDTQRRRRRSLVEVRTEPVGAYTEYVLAG